METPFNRKIRKTLCYIIRIWATPLTYLRRLTQDLLKKSRRNDWRDLKICSVILAGLLIEALLWRFAASNPEYLEYRVRAIMLGFLLTIYCAAILRKVGGSVRIFAYMTLILCAIVLNILYLYPSNYHAIKPYREEYFAPAYRLAEILIIVSAAREILCCLYLLTASTCRSICAMVTGRNLHF